MCNPLSMSLATDLIKIFSFIQKGRTSLHAAAYYGHSEVVKALIQSSANLNIQDNVSDNNISYIFIENFQLVQFCRFR